MRKLLCTLALILGLFATTNAVYAQDVNSEASKFHVGGGATYATDTDFGINLNGYYSITPSIRAGADFRYYLGDPEGVSTYEINANGQYLFNLESEITPYLLAGLNYMVVSVDTGPFSGSDSEVGLNVGGGLEYPVDFGLAFVEAKYVLGNANQLGVNAGVRVAF